MGSLVRSSGNALAEFGNVNPWAEAARDVETGAYLKFNGNSGELTFGSDDTVLPEGSQLIVDMRLFATGWMCWVNSEPKEEILISVVDQATGTKLPLEHELTDHGPYDDDDGWRKAASFPAIILEFGSDADAGSHEAVGTKLLFKTSTGGAVKSALRLSGSYGKQFMQKVGSLPVVEFKIDSYTPREKKFGKKYAISFTIVGWISEDEVAGLMDGAADADGDYEPEPETAPEPVKPVAAPKQAPRRAAAPAPAPEPEVEDEVPVEVEEEVPAPAPRTRRAAAPVEAEPAAEEDTVPAPRGRSPGRGAPPANARVRRFG